MDADLVAAAREARLNAHAPYSRFHVGAAIRDGEGRIHAGCNVENAAYPLGTCAEAGAISAMVMAGGTRIAAIAIAGPDGEPCPPCGGCRQRIREFAGPDTPVLLVTGPGRAETHRLGALLPHAFGPDHLD